MRMQLHIFYYLAQQKSVIRQFPAYITRAINSKYYMLLRIQWYTEIYYHYNN